MGLKPKLMPLRDYPQGDYPQAKSKGSLKGVLVAAAMTATSLGGCGPAIDSRSVDSVLDAGDLDGAVVNCTQHPDDPRCTNASSSSGTAGSTSTGGNNAGGTNAGGTSAGGTGGVESGGGGK